MNMTETNHFTEKGSVFQFPDIFSETTSLLIESLPLRFLAMERNTTVVKQEGDTRELWNGFLLAHPLTADKIGDEGYSLVESDVIAKLFDWIILPQVITIIDTSQGKKISQLNERYMHDLETRIKKRQTNKNLSHECRAVLNHYKHLAIKLRMHACWKY